MKILRKRILKLLLNEFLTINREVRMNNDSKDYNGLVVKTKM